VKTPLTVLTFFFGGPALTRRNVTAPLAAAVIYLDRDDDHLNIGVTSLFFPRPCDEMRAKWRTIVLVRAGCTSLFFFSFFFPPPYSLFVPAERSSGPPRFKISTGARISKPLKTPSLPSFFSPFSLSSPVPCWLVASLFDGEGHGTAMPGSFFPPPNADAANYKQPMLDFFSPSFSFS